MLNKVTPKVIHPFMKTVLPTLYKERPPKEFSISQGRFLSEPEYLEPARHRIPILNQNNLEHYLKTHWEGFKSLPLLIGLAEPEYKALLSEIKGSAFKSHKTGHSGFLFRPNVPHAPHPKDLLKIRTVAEFEEYIKRHKTEIGFTPLAVGLQKEEYGSLLKSIPGQPHGTFVSTLPERVVLKDVEVFLAKPSLHQHIYLIKTTQHVNL